MVDRFSGWQGSLPAVCVKMVGDGGRVLGRFVIAREPRRGATVAIRAGWGKRPSVEHTTDRSTQIATPLRGSQ
ncbi:MAG: hypothetical protein ACYDGL_13070 [Bellilinea sp.]